MKILNLETLFLYLFSLLIFMPHFVVVTSGTYFTTFSPRAYSISLIIFIFSLPFFISYYKNKQLKITYLTKIIILYIFMYLISTFFSENFYNSFFGWQYRNKGFLIISTMLFISIISPYILDNLNKIKKIIDIGIFFSCIYSIYGILQFFKLDPFCFVSTAGERIFSFFINPNYFSPIILIFLFFSLNKLIFESKQIYIISFLLNLTAIIFSQTFTTYLSIIITIPIYFFISLKYFPELKKKNIKLIVIFILPLILFSSISVFVIFKYNPNLLNRYINLTTLKTRIYLWRDLGIMIKNEFKIKEYLLGIGGENLNRKFMPYKSSELEKIEPNVLYDNSHNEYIDQFIKGGFFLATIYFVIIIYSLYALFTRIRKTFETKETSFFVFISLLSYSINLLGTYETIQMFLFFSFLLSLVNSLLALEINNVNLKISINLTILIFLIISFINFNYHTYLKLYTDNINMGYNLLDFYKYIKNLEKENSIKYLKESEKYLLKSQKYIPFDKTFATYYLAKIYFQYSIELNDTSYVYKSLEILNKNLSKTQYPNSYFNLMGDEYYFLKNIEKAKEYYRKSLEWSKFYNESILSLIKIYIDENNLIEAEKYVDIILSLKENAIAYKFKGIIYLKKGELELSKKFLKRAIELGDKEAKELVKLINN